MIEVSLSTNNLPICRICLQGFKPINNEEQTELQGFSKNGSLVISLDRNVAENVNSCACNDGLCLLCLKSWVQEQVANSYKTGSYCPDCKSYYLLKVKTTDTPVEQPIFHQSGRCGDFVFWLVNSARIESGWSFPLLLFDIVMDILFSVSYSFIVFGSLNNVSQSLIFAVFVAVFFQRGLSCVRLYLVNSRISSTSYQDYCFYPNILIALMCFCYTILFGASLLYLRYSFGGIPTSSVLSIILLAFLSCIYILFLISVNETKRSVYPEFIYSNLNQQEAVWKYNKSRLSSTYASGPVNPPEIGVQHIHIPGTQRNYHFELHLTPNQGLYQDLEIEVSWDMQKIWGS